MKPTPMQQAIIESCDHIKALLLEKNKHYGNSALDPIRLFSKASPVEQLLVRIDDKLSRMRTVGLSFEGGDESSLDTLYDLIGYLHLLHIQVSQEAWVKRLREKSRGKMNGSKVRPTGLRTKGVTS